MITNIIPVYSSCPVSRPAAVVVLLVEVDVLVVRVLLDEVVEVSVLVLEVLVVRVSSDTGACGGLEQRSPCEGNLEKL